MPRGRAFPEEDNGTAKAVRLNNTSENLIVIDNIIRLPPIYSRVLKREQHTRHVDLRQINLRHGLAPFGERLMDMQEQIDSTWRTILDDVIDDASPDDIITGYVEHSSLAYDVWLKPVEKRNIRYDEFLNGIGK